MRANVRLWLTGAATLLVGVWFWTGAGPGQAADDEKDPKEDVLKLADALEKNDAEAAKKQAEAIGKANEVEAIMALFKLRSKKGIGFGEKPGANKTTDGIEARIMAMSKKAPPAGVLAKESKDVARAAYIAAAIGESVQDKPPVTEKQGEKDPAKWKQWSKEMSDSALKLAEAAKDNKPAAVKTAAGKLNASCNNCHAVFRE